MRHVIVGGGVAGITAAAELAKRQAGEIVVYSEEPHPYYFRPRLPHFVGGQVVLENLFARSPAWYQERGIEVYLSSKVVHLLPGEKSIHLQSGEEVAYDRLLLATGGVPFVPPMEGVDKAGVFCLRTLDDAIAIKKYAAQCRQAVVIGGGLLGLETAKGLRDLGLEVTALEASTHLCPRQLDVEGASIFQTLIERLGIEVGLEADAEEVIGQDKVEGVVVRDGRTYPADMLVVAAGIRCNIALAAHAGAKIEGCVDVDEHMATNMPDIYSAGDAAGYQGRTWGIIPIARAQALVAAANMAGERIAYQEPPPSTTLKIAGIALTSIGSAIPVGDGYFDIRVDDAESGAYRKLVLHEGRLVGAIVIGDGALARELGTLVASGARMTPEEALQLL
jgi:nitrite reductase (NADH) large subunit